MLFTKKLVLIKTESIVALWRIVFFISLINCVSVNTSILMQATVAALPIWLQASFLRKTPRKIYSVRKQLAVRLHEFIGRFNLLK